MQITQSFMMAIKSLSKSKMRAFLTMLGIIIGIGSVIIIVSLGQGMANMMNETFETFGTNIINVSITGRGSTRSVSVDDMYQLVKDNPEYLDEVSPNVTLSLGVTYGSNSVESTTITGCNEQYINMKGYDLSNGRFIEYVDTIKRLKVCTIGSYIANELFGKANPVGNKIKINGNYYTIVGVLEEVADSKEGTSDDAIYIPYTNAAKMQRNARISSYIFTIQNENEADLSRTVIENKLYSVFESDDYYKVISMSEMLDTVNELMGTVMLVLEAIAAISLLVGGIGIMNIMLVSVTERTREIGIRKSLGAKYKDIMSQFVIEAATTSAVGGVLGIAMGMSLASIAGNLVDIKAVPTVESVMTAFLVSLAIGVLFGFLPARKAAKLNPIDALHSD